MTHMVILSGKALAKLTPAVLEAMIVENGLMVEIMVPILVPRKIVPRTVIVSYPASRKTGIRIGYMAIVSSARPKVVPPREIRPITRMINRTCLPLIFLDKACIPELIAPFAWTTPIHPPRIKTKAMMSTLWAIPCTCEVKNWLIACHRLGFFKLILS